MGVAEAIVGEFRFLSDPQQAGRCAVDDILVDDLFGDDLKRSGLHRFGACIEGAVGNCLFDAAVDAFRSEEHTSELQSLMRISYAVFCLKKKTKRDQKFQS